MGGPAYHLYIDFIKAFHSALHETLWSVLGAYQFPDSMIQAFKNLEPMRPTGGGIFFERTSVFEGRFESSNEDSNSKTVFALIAIQLNPIESKLLGRIAAKAQQQQRAHQIDRRLPQICARKTQICARKTQICARKKGFFCFFN